MKIQFDSPQEIQQLARLLQEIYPAELVITVDDLLDAKKGVDRELPWNFDGFHPPMEISRTENDCDELHCLVISGKEQAERFANAIEESWQEAQHPKPTPDLKITHLRSAEEIKRFVARRKRDTQ